MWRERTREREDTIAMERRRKTYYVASTEMRREFMATTEGMRKSVDIASMERMRKNIIIMVRSFATSKMVWGIDIEGV